jgi:uncharacterized protein (DUF2267 family)
MALLQVTPWGHNGGVTKGVNVKRIRLTQVVDGSVDLALHVEDLARRTLGERATAPIARGRRRLARRMRHTAGRLEGLAYRIAGRHPDPDVDDRVLADRVASTLGSVTRHLDLPRVHVTAKDGVVHLAGRIDSLDAFHEIERAVRAIPGVRDIRTAHLRRMGPADTRPSEGAATRRSKALHDLLQGVNALDIGDEEDARRLVGAILAVFLRILPEDPRRHFETHLPADVKALTEEALIIGAMERPRSMEDFVAMVADAAARTTGTAELVTRRVLADLRELVPEEVDDIAAVLPREIKQMWEDPMHAEFT